jgi:hypothetical protein
MAKKTITRRDFLKATSVAPLAASFIPALKSGPLSRPAAGDKVPVVLIRDPNVLKADGTPDPDIVRKMLDQTVSVITGESDPLAAWKTLIRPEDIVGIKSNVWRYIPTTPEVEQVIKGRVMDVGVAEDRIGIDDRGVLRNPVFQRATALINARPARTHNWSGVGSLIKNYITFVPRPAEWHGDTCADLAKIWYLPEVKDKTRLNILSVLTPQFHGVGPHSFSKEYVWEYNGFIVSRDPVAADVIGLRILESKRREYFGEDRPLRPTPHHVFLADTRHGLGVSSEDRIELVRLGWSENILI